MAKVKGKCVYYSGFGHSWINNIIVNVPRGKTTDLSAAFLFDGWFC